MAADTVDQIDISALFEPSAADRPACDATLWAGLRRTGAVTITGYPEANQIDTGARTGLKIFDQPADLRRALTTRIEEPGNPNWYRGYWPRRPERLLQNDFFDVGPDQPDPGPDLPGMHILTEPTPWPDPATMPGWQEKVRMHYARLNRVAQAMIRSLGRSAGFAEAEIDARFAGSHSTLRFLDYAAGAQSPAVGADGVSLSAGRHTDASGLSLLWQDKPGLQAEGPDGVFRDIPMIPNAISVHVGDVMTTLTRGAIPATPHRVLASPAPRRSVGFFLEPALSAAVTPAEAGQGPVVPEQTYGWQLLCTFAARPHWRGVIQDPGGQPPA